MNRLEITKEEFEQFVPIARFPDDKIFMRVSRSFDTQYSFLVENYTGVSIDNEIDKQSDDLKIAINRFVCISSFLSKLRANDVVMTATGFGVVSNTNVAPASQQRVDSLNSEILNDYDEAVDLLVDQLIKTDGWSDTPQSILVVDNLCYKKTFFSLFGSNSQTISHQEWMRLKLDLHRVDRIVRKLVSSDYMTELISLIRSSADIAKKDMLIIRLCRQLMIMTVNKVDAQSLSDEIINILENNISDYPTYAASKEYAARHIQRYENTADDPTFFF
jgi:hypothetical protein